MPSKARQIDVIIEPVMLSATMRKLNATLRLVANKDVVITLTGESGTGKEVLARQVHDLSGRRSGPFIPINCAAIPESLFESELFGHERGAFTGATERARGKIEAATGGTLFLDEIGEMPLPMQAKLLRFLENRRFMRVGGTQKLQADVRLICATLRPLDEEMRAGRFRPDLYYRIQGITLLVPPLRNRRADIPALINQFVSQLTAKHGTKAPILSRRTRAVLLNYSWPGNVRELKNAIEMFCLLRAGKKIRPGDMPPALQTAQPQVTSDRIEITLNQSLDAISEQVIEAVLAAERGNRSRAAARLGMSVRTIQRLLHTRGKQDTL